MEILPECFTSSTITASQSTASLLQNPPSLSMKYAQWLQPTGSPADQVMECTQETTALGRPSLDLLLPEARGINQPFIELNYSDSRFPAFTASLCTTLRCRTFFQIISKNITVQNRHCSRQMAWGRGKQNQVPHSPHFCWGKKSYEWNIRTDCCSTSPDYSESQSHKFIRKKQRERERDKIK